jgi:repressor LexA
MPTFAEVGKLIGLSVSTVHFHVNALKEHNFLSATDTGRLVPGKKFFNRTVVSSVRAGALAYADDSTPESLLIDQYLIDTPSRTFLLTIKGYSMKDVGLLPGDCVVVKRGLLPQVGDIVVVEANGEGTVKELAQHPNGDYFLKARNPDYPDISPADGFEIMGVVVGEFRKYTRSRTAPHPVLQVVQKAADPAFKERTDSGCAAPKVQSTLVGMQVGKVPHPGSDSPKFASPES